MSIEFAGAIAAAKHAYDLTAGVFKLRDQVAINNAVIEIQQAVLDVQAKLNEAQSGYNELLEKKNQSDDALKARDNWDSVAARYKLEQVADGVFLWVLVQEGGEPKHMICPHCYEERKKSILQKSGTYVECPACELEVRVYPPTDDFRPMSVPLG